MVNNPLRWPRTAVGSPSLTPWLLRRAAQCLTLTLLVALLTWPLTAAHATEAAPVAADSALEARMMRIAAELRCLVCQNQTIADSHADLAVDLRQEVREMLQKGQTDQQVLDFMTARYGDFVLYRPPVKSTTWLLWYGPLSMAVLGMVVLIVVLRRRSRMPAQHFDPDDTEPS